MTQGEKKGRKERHAPKCFGCRTTLSGAPVRIGRRRYHSQCAAQKPRYRQEWNWEPLQWKRIGVWSDEEDVTLRGQA